MWIIFFSVYFICAFLASGASFGHFQNKYREFAAGDYWDDMFISICMAIIGPLGLLFIYTLDRCKYGFKWW